MGKGSFTVFLPGLGPLYFLLISVPFAAATLQSKENVLSFLPLPLSQQPNMSGKEGKGILSYRMSEGGEAYRVSATAHRQCFLPISILTAQVFSLGKKTGNNS